MQRQENIVGLLISILLVSCVPKTPQRSPVGPPPPKKAEVKPAGAVPEPEPSVGEEWCFESTTISKNGTPFKSNICLTSADKCKQLAKHYKSTGGLIGVEYVSECKAR